MVDVDMENNLAPQFSLSQVIEAHKSDVKALATTTSGIIISGSRDENVKVFVTRFTLISIRFCCYQLMIRLVWRRSSLLQLAFFLIFFAF